jgi:peptidoglycan/LPS O-acetylase OafA/YrhL
MERRRLLMVDGAINLILGLLLLTFWPPLVQWLGMPATETPFYASVLGAVLLGIGIALMIETRRKPGGPVGLGLAGAVAINLCGGVALAAWLLGGQLNLPLRGQVLLWLLALALVGISAFEVVAFLRHKANSGDP